MKLWYFNYQTLRIFVEVARTGNMTATATNLGITQPLVSQRIASFEQELGVQLFVRDRKRLTLTVAGETLYRRLDKVVDDIVFAVQDAIEQQYSDGKRLSIGVFAGISEEALMNVSRILSQADKENHVSISVFQQADFFDKLANHEFDLYITPDYGEIAADENLVSHPVWEDCFYVGHNVDDALDNSELYWRDIENQQIAAITSRNWHIGNEYSYSSKINSYCRKNGFEPQFVFCDNNESVKLIVCQGLGISLTSPFYYNSAHKGIAVTPIRDSHYRISLAYEVNQPNRAMLEQFVRKVQPQLQDYFVRYEEISLSDM